MRLLCWLGLHGGEWEPMTVFYSLVPGVEWRFCMRCGDVRTRRV